MKFKEALDEVLHLRTALPGLFGRTVIQSAFDNRPPIGDWSNSAKPGMLVSGDGIGSQSGLYFFSSEQSRILYIGKATKKNLHHRVWNHLKTPDITDNGWRTFPKHSFMNARDAADITNQVLNGRISLNVITFSDPDLVSCAEVYLQTVHIKRYGCLPIFNKQIG